MYINSKKENSKNVTYIREKGQVQNHYNLIFNHLYLCFVCAKECFLLGEINNEVKEIIFLY